MKCSVCGSELPGGCKFCPECGYHVGRSATDASEGKPAESGADVPNMQNSSETPAPRGEAGNAPTTVPPADNGSCPSPAAPQTEAQPPKKAGDPIYKRWYFWVIIGVVILIAAGVASSRHTSTGNSVTTATSRAASGAARSTAAKTTAAKTTQPTTQATTIPPTTSLGDYISNCQSVPYDDLARYPDNYKGTKLMFRGKVVQVSEGYFGVTNYRISVTQGSYGIWTDTVFVTYSLPSGSAKILEDDIVDIYGESTGAYTYTAVMGQSVTIPGISAVYIGIES